MPRFHLPAERWDAACLDGEEAKHCAQVLRQRVGDEVEVFDGAGRRARVRLVSVTKQACDLAFLEVEQTAATANPLHLAVAVPKGKTMDLIVQKAVELGISRITPLATEHSVVRIDPKDGARKQAKWQRVALEACKQCGQNFVPEVEAVSAFGDFLSAMKAESDGAKIIASLASGARPMYEVLGALKAPLSTTLLVGPEGDFSATETTHALAAGFSPISLGSIVLRVETAVLFALSALRYELSKFEQAEA